MNILTKNFWKSAATTLLGIVIGLLIAMKLKKPEVVINKNQTVGKIKQKGRNNDQDVELTRSGKGVKLTRKERWAKNKAERRAKKANKKS
jgi:hypothetical protein